MISKLIRVYAAAAAPGPTDDLLLLLLLLMVVIVAGDVDHGDDHVDFDVDAADDDDNEEDEGVDGDDDDNDDHDDDADDGSGDDFHITIMVFAAGELFLIQAWLCFSVANFIGRFAVISHFACDFRTCV